MRQWYRTCNIPGATAYNRTMISTPKRGRFKDGTKTLGGCAEVNDGPGTFNLVGSIQHCKNCTERFRLLRGMWCPQVVRTLGVRSAPCRDVRRGGGYPGGPQKMTRFARGGRVENGAYDHPGCVSELTTRVSLIMTVNAVVTPGPGVPSWGSPSSQGAPYPSV
jgi:hypothetical protein